MNMKKIDNAIVYETITERLGNFDIFKKEIIKALQNRKKKGETI